MRESLFTGKEIFESIKRMEAEVKELEQALDVISNEIGQGCLPYNIVEKQRVEASQKLSEMYRTKYIVKVENNGGLF
jgi:septation ring formation regulator EzrA